MEAGKPFEELIAENMARLRKAAGLSQAKLADDMALRGLPWNRSTVAQVETARRGLALAEALALAAALDVPLARLIAADGLVQVGEGTWWPGYLAATLAGSADDAPWDEAYNSPAAKDADVRAAGTLEVILRERPRAKAEFYRRWGKKVQLGRSCHEASEADSAMAVRLARELHLTVYPADVVEAARRRWGHSLEEEREARVTKDHRSEGATGRTLQALRGHVTRQLAKEIAEEIEQAVDRSVAGEDNR